MNAITKLLIGIILIISLAGIAVASPTLLINVSAGNTWTGLEKINVSVTGTGNASNVTIWVSAVDTNDTAARRLNNSIAAGEPLMNNTIGNHSVNVQTITLEDSSLWSVYATANNNSNASESLTTATVTIIVDNGAPTVPTGITPAADSTQNSRGDVSFSATVNSRNTTHGWIEFKDLNPGSKTYRTPRYESSSNISVTVTNMPEGEYKWRWVASDGADTAVSEYQSLFVSQDSGAGKSVYYAQQQLQQQQLQQQREGQAGQISAPTVLVLLAAVIIILKFIKKKRR